ncbi:MAG: hypothetical protein MJA30_32385 [Cytophagales bacterium]|nr:hypothetical protein [Cytophagales bacterium]
MAEIDLKDIWQKGAGALGSGNVTLQPVETQRSRTVLYWLRVILSIEFWLNNIITPLAVYHEFSKNSKATAIFLIVVGIVYFIYYIFLIRQIRRFDFSGNVRESLSKIYGYLKFYLLHYKVVFFAALYFGGFYGFYEAAAADGGFVLGSQIIWPLLLLVVALIPVYLIFHFLINLVYGRKIKRLKAIIEGLRDD